MSAKNKRKVWPKLGGRGKETGQRNVGNMLILQIYWVGN